MRFSKRPVNNHPTIEEPEARAWLTEGALIRRYGNWGRRRINHPDGRYAMIGERTWDALRQDLEPANASRPTHLAMMRLK